jgi:predicted nucleic acid-binding protein
MVIEKCLDTYILIEIYLGNENFLDYLKKEFVITDLTLAEFIGVLLRDYGEEDANFWFKKLESYSVSANKEILIEAVKFRYKHKKTDISFFDAVGYIFALKNGYRFVTGDKEFKNLINVEFKKK